jgi:hypothetical protein
VTNAVIQYLILCRTYALRQLTLVWLWYVVGASLSLPGFHSAVCTSTMTSPMHLFLDRVAKDDAAFPAHEYATLLLKEGLEFNGDLRYITKVDLEEAGVKVMGHRLRIIRAIREEFGPPDVEFDYAPEGAVSFQNPLAAAAAAAPAPAPAAASSSSSSSSSSSTATTTTTTTTTTKSSKSRK